MPAKRNDNRYKRTVTVGRNPDGSAKRSLDAYLTDPRRVYANFVRQVVRPKP